MVKKRFQKVFLVMVFIMTVFALLVRGQGGNLVSNFSFETQDPLNSTQANSWQTFTGSYSRVHTFSVWDQNFIAQLSSGGGAMQRITLNQTVAIPVLITVQIKGDNIANDPNDTIGAIFDCKVQYRDGTLRWCPTTPKTKNVGTFDWKLAGWNTMSLYPVPVPVDWIEVRVRMGNVSGTAFFDDVHVEEVSPKTSGMVTFRFDDSLRSTYTKAYPMLAARGFVGSEAVITSYVGADAATRVDSTHMTWEELHDLAAHGWTMLSHTEHHFDLSTLGINQLNDELYWSHKYLVDNGFPVSHLALPLGGYNAQVISRAQAEWYGGYFYRSVTSSDNGVNPQGVFPYNIFVQEIKLNTTVAQVQAWLTTAKNNKSWLVLLLHEVDNANGPYTVTSATLNAILDAVADSGLPVVTYDRGFTEITKP